MKRIIAQKHGTIRAFGPEHKVLFIKDGKVLESTTVFSTDLRSADRAFTKEFEGVKVERMSIAQMKEEGLR